MSATWRCVWQIDAVTSDDTIMIKVKSQFPCRFWLLTMTSHLFAYKGGRRHENWNCVHVCCTAWMTSSWFSITCCDVTLYSITRWDVMLIWSSQHAATSHDVVTCYGLGLMLIWSWQHATTSHYFGDMLWRHADLAIVAYCDWTWSLQTEHGIFVQLYYVA